MGHFGKMGLKWLVSSLVISNAHAFYIPGWSVRSYKDNDQIPLLVNKVYSDNTQLQYAYNDLPFVCPPTGKMAGGGLLGGQSISLNLGEVLRGDRIITSDLDLAMGKDQECSFVCNKEITGKDLKWAQELVKDGYVVEWIVDNLPGATSFVTVDKSRKYYASGFKLGFTDYSASTGRPRYFLNNHHTIVVRHRRAPGRAGERGEKVIVGFEVYTKSIGPGVRRENGCPKDLHNIEESFELYMAPNKTTDLTLKYPDSSYYPEQIENIDDDAKMTVPYTYSVYFREDESIEWNHRWDLYFVNQEEGSKIHWLAIVNSLIICGLLTGIVLMILAKTIRTDIRNYREGIAEDGKFRALACWTRKVLAKKTWTFHPKMRLSRTLRDGNSCMLTSSGNLSMGIFWLPLVGSGMQLLFMAVGLVLLSAIGVLNPSFRGGFISAGVGLFIFGSAFSGYFSARVYRTFDGQDFRRNALVTAVLFPGLLFGLIFILNLFVWAQASSTAIPFGTLIALALLWLCIQVPLVYAGAWYGFVRTGAWEHPTKTSSIPRQIPHQAWYAKSLQSILLAGLIPFAVIFIELLFVFQSMWQDKSGYYYVFGFLAVVSVILIITIAEVTVVTVYIQLCSENYHWWWQSFFVGGGSAVWVFLYCVWYYFVKLHITGFVSSMLFFSYSFMACCVYGLLTGTVGFLTAYTFVRRIYK
ncbi:endomembrane protein 70 [Apiospora rasikravindrae]|uniref:Transmembrane 9 superfamily member n=1 Tax=Apiospora rasikravindrae TaxID=990691 RepID=A0ABR1TWP8_9PEZI